MRTIGLIKKEDPKKVIAQGNKPQTVKKEEVKKKKK
jgi:hypothetical protein